MTSTFANRLARRLWPQRDVPTPTPINPSIDPEPDQAAEIEFLSHIRPTLERAEAAASEGDLERTLDILRELSLEEFSELLLFMPTPGYSRLARLLPSMASSEVQKNWTGSSGHDLLDQSTTFVRQLALNYAEIRGRGLGGRTILDFGCGYGRILRLMLYYSNPDRLYGVDPWDRSIELSQEAGLLAHLAQSDYLPKTLPFDDTNFDVIYCFSVFTHLSERATAQALSALRQRINPDGVLVITLRPVEYWDFEKRVSTQEKAALIAHHERDGFAFWPHKKREPVDGDITYGDTSMTIDYVGRSFPDWRVLRYDRSLRDPYQILLFLEPA